MKKLFLPPITGRLPIRCRHILLSLLLSLLTWTLAGNRASAQITGISVDSMSVVVFNPCHLPDSVSVIFICGVTGTIPPGDSVRFEVNFGDGSTITFKRPLSVSYPFAVGPIRHRYQFPGTYSILARGTTSNNLSDVVVSTPHTFSSACASLSGHLYHDANQNCTRETNENPIPHRMITFTSGTAAYFAITDATGHYRIDLPEGNTYTITPDASYLSLTPTCPASGTATVTLLPAGTYVRDFAFDCTAPVDVWISGWANRWRPGFERAMSLAVGNTQACTVTPAVITATLPPELTYAGTAPGFPPPTVAGNVLTWQVASLPPYTGFYTSINLFCATTATLGTQLCIPLTVSPTPIDGVTANNFYTLCSEVSNSFDPWDPLESTCRHASLSIL